MNMRRTMMTIAALAVALTACSDSQPIQPEPTAEQQEELVAQIDATTTQHDYEYDRSDTPIEWQVRLTMVADYAHPGIVTRPVVMWDVVVVAFDTEQAEREALMSVPWGVWQLQRVEIGRN